MATLEELKYVALLVVCYARLASLHHCCVGNDRTLTSSVRRDRRNFPKQRSLAASIRSKSEGAAFDELMTPALHCGLPSILAHELS